MATLLQHVVDTLCQPKEITNSESAPDTVKLYYRQFPGSVLGSKWVCVVVKYLEDDAFILTSYPSDRIGGIRA